MIALNNPVYVEVFGETAGGCLLGVNNVEFRRGKNLKLQIMPVRMSLDLITLYVSVQLKPNSKNEVHIEDCLNRSTIAGRIKTIKRSKNIAHQFERW